jgi:uncharacterized protein YjbJ (UPF0337 family)
MNTDRVAGSFKEIEGKIKQKWGLLTNDDITLADGRMEVLAGRIQQRYGLMKEEAEKQLDEFIKAQQTHQKEKEKASHAR